MNPAKIWLPSRPRKPQVPAEPEEVHQLPVEREARRRRWRTARRGWRRRTAARCAGSRGRTRCRPRRRRRATGFGESRMTAKTMPSSTPMQHRQHRHDQRRPRSAQDRGREHVVEHEAPLEHGVREQHVHEHRDEHRDQAGGDPPAGVAHRHRLDLLGRCRSASVVSVVMVVAGQPTVGFTVGSSMAPSSTPHVRQDLLVGAVVDQRLSPRRRCAWANSVWSFATT